MQLTGSNFIGRRPSKSSNQFFVAKDPASGEDLEGAFAEATEGEIDAAVSLAEEAFLKYQNTSNEARASFLEAIADEILALGDVLVQRAMAETSLPQGRIQGERGRTMGQMKLFAKVVREGSWVDARVDPAMPDRDPMPRADIRSMLQPLGPVTIFGASNFPLAFSVAGGDTASALASGCTVVIKGHPAHPSTSELVFQAILKAAEKTGMPDGVASLIHGTTHEVGGLLVKHPLIQAVGFTGSFGGGKALFDLANKRPQPIPVFSEMGSTNPVFILPGAMRERGEQIAAGLAGSVTLGVGQFCTNPGLVVLPDGPVEEFKSKLSEEIAGNGGGTMLTSGIKAAYEKGAKKVGDTTDVTSIAEGKVASTDAGVQAKVFLTKSGALKAYDYLSEEVFGPSTLLVESSQKSELIDIAKELKGHLTATIHGTDEDLEAYKDLLQILTRKVGRIVINGFPTGVEVCHAMVHGGPYPSTTNSQSTSVGTAAIKRFARPVCYQDLPDSLLPDALKAANPNKIWRLVDGAFRKD
ncbi:UNVERIFIED_CONTAM: hypothetical protein GTU68_035761 [Idotea baltica]|nr:hypothetical protein [Idotea baltica]